MFILPVLRRLVRHMLCKTSWWGVNLLIVGRTKNCREAIKQIEGRRQLGYIPVGYVSCGVSRANHPDPCLLGTIDEAAKIAKTCKASVVGLASSRERIKNLDRLLGIFSGVVWISHTSIANHAIDTSGLPEVLTNGRSMPFLRFIPRWTKRFIDLAFCIALLILIFLPMAAIGLAITLASPGPVFFASRRVGQHGKRFKMWKFRSMVPDAKEVLLRKLASDPLAAKEWALNHKLKDDPRIIPVIGNIIRRCSLDELPQLWNVIRGEMSLVGPRPVPEDEVLKYGRTFYEYTQMLPGITGLWQVSGRNDTSYDTRLFLVHQYAINWSPWLDVWILAKTPVAVLTKRGAY